MPSVAADAPTDTIKRDKISAHRLAPLADKGIIRDRGATDNRRTALSAGSSSRASQPRTAASLSTADSHLLRRIIAK